jgi:D-amino-acid dehydrogenase
MLADPLEPLTIRWQYLPRLSRWLYEFIRASSPHRIEEISKALNSLLTLAVELYVPLLSETETERFVTRSGLLYAYRSDAAFAADQVGIELRRRRGVRLEVLNGADVGQLEPALGGKCAHGVFCPDTALTANPYGLVSALGRRFLAAGGEFVHADVVDIGVCNGRPNGLATTSGLYPSIDWSLQPARGRDGWHVDWASTFRWTRSAAISRCSRMSNAIRGYHLSPSIDTSRSRPWRWVSAWRAPSNSPG